MAFNINPALVLALKSPRNWRGILRHRFRSQINVARSYRQSKLKPTLKYRGSSLKNFDFDEGITKEFEHQAEHFKKYGWAYISNFFASDIHSRILRAWPSLNYFTVGSDPTKSYDKGPRWSASDAHSLNPGINPEFYLGFECLKSQKFEDRVSQFCDDGIQRVNSSLGSAWARTGSLLLPHIDDVWQFGRGAVINFVVFVDGTNPVEQSGSTSIYSTNDFTDPIFVPPCLSNTALVYETGRFIYHGFPRVGRGKFSKRLIAQYSPENQPKFSQIRGAVAQDLSSRTL
jgi:hypothetical protein